MERTRCRMRESRRVSTHDRPVPHRCRSTMMFLKSEDPICDDESPRAGRGSRWASAHGRRGDRRRTPLRPRDLEALRLPRYPGRCPDHERGSTCAGWRAPRRSGTSLAGRMERDLGRLSCGRRLAHSAHHQLALPGRHAGDLVGWRSSPRILSLGAEPLAAAASEADGVDIDPRAGRSGSIRSSLPRSVDDRRPPRHDEVADCGRGTVPLGLVPDPPRSRHTSTNLGELLHEPVERHLNDSVSGSSGGCRGTARRADD